MIEFLLLLIIVQLFVILKLLPQRPRKLKRIDFIV